MLSLENCTICPRNCGVNRYLEAGYCRAGDKIKVNLSQLHYGEEPNLSGTNGSGTIFFSNCNLKCIYCQNFTISHFAWGNEIENKELAETMLKLQEKGAHNINLVTPTHFSLQLIEALKLAKEMGLSIPIVWNSNAYEKVDTLKLLNGLVDIYLPDLRYFSSEAAAKYSEAEDYPEIAKEAIKEMFRQVGHIKENNGLAVKGLMIRLLILPGNVNQTDKALDWIYHNIGPETFISLMGQYYPTYLSSNYPELNRGISEEEYNFVVNKLYSLGFDNGYVQDRGSSKFWTPDFSDNAHK